ncbi:MAG: glycosyltransferase family 4 protein [Microcoleaceae cyanobacterium MO_207.B10]|nr:glycosyltransferase family 4 protein [Microcoleaceae cyanobacterium MO_207.B10]
MKVAYITAHNPHNPFSWSGTNYYMFKSLQAQGLDVTHVGKSLWPWSRHLPKPFQGIARRFDRQNNSSDDFMAAASKSAKLLEKELQSKPYDIIFTPVSSVECGSLNTSLPMVYLSDGTFRLLKDYYSYMMQQPEKVREHKDFLEAKIIERADSLVFSSQWAANSAIQDYHTPPEKVHIVPFGPNIERVEDLNTILEQRQMDEIRLLFVGGDWERKGGPIAFETVRALNEMGIKAQLIVCGATPPEKHQAEYVSSRGYLQKHQPQQLEELISLLCSCHFMFVPSRADCTPIVFCEASAYALPVISTQTGGISSVVFEGENGYLLPLEATGEDFAKLIANIFQDREKYLQLAMSTRKTYEDKLNWNQWGSKVRQLLESLV